MPLLGKHISGRSLQVLKELKTFSTIRKKQFFWSKEMTGGSHGISVEPNLSASLPLTFPPILRKNHNPELFAICFLCLNLSTYIYQAIHVFLGFEGLANFMQKEKVRSR